nr:uncharacterized protein CFP56_03774 [Quercus suber]
MTKAEWTDNIVRDSYASFVGHPPLLYYMSIGMNQPMEITRNRYVRKMVMPGQPIPEEDYHYPGKPQWQPYDASNDVPGTMEVDGKPVKSEERNQAQMANLIGMAAIWFQRSSEHGWCLDKGHEIMKMFSRWLFCPASKRSRASQASDESIGMLACATALKHSQLRARIGGCSRA